MNLLTSLVWLCIGGALGCGLAGFSMGAVRAQEDAAGMLFAAAVFGVAAIILDQWRSR